MGTELEGSATRGKKGKNIFVHFVIFLMEIRVLMDITQGGILKLVFVKKFDGVEDTTEKEFEPSRRICIPLHIHFVTRQFL